MRDLALIDHFASRYGWTHDYVTELTMEFFYQLRLLHILQDAQKQKADAYVANLKAVKDKLSRPRK